MSSRRGNEVEASVDNFIELTVVCDPRPPAGCFVYRNAGTVYCH